MMRIWKKKKGFTLIELMIVIAIIAILAAILVPNFMRARASGQLTACKANLKNQGTALEMYATDNNGRYPTAIGDLSSDYLRKLPTCPATDKEYGYSGDVTPDAYTVYCSDTDAHKAVNVETGYPQYDSVQGLMDRV